MSEELKGTMKIEFIGHDFKENLERTKIPIGKLKLPEGTSGELLYVGEDDLYLHCFVVDSGAYYGVFKSDDKDHIYQHLLKLNTGLKLKMYCKGVLEMDSDQQEMCATASLNARALEEMMITVDDVLTLNNDDVGDIIDRCEQIIHCMQECFDG